MVTRRSLRREILVPVLFAGILGGAHAGPQPAEQAEPRPRPAPYVRVVDVAEGMIELQVAVRTMEPPASAEGEPWPTVHLAGAVHIADQPFYDQLQEFLDSRDVVLFEGVKPPGAGRALGAADDAKRAEVTEHRLRFLATAAAMYRAEHKAAPGTLQDLAAGVDRRLGGLVAGAMADAWGNPIVMTGAADAEADAVDFVSLGADGAPGGDGPDRDLRLSDQEPIGEDEIGEDGGIQTQLASALGLVFQKDGMDWAKANWRNSDLSVDEIMDRLDASGAQADGLFGMLQGNTLSAKVAGFVLRLIGMSPTSQAIGKLMIAEMLGQAEELVTVAPGMEAMMRVIIEDRNAVVVEDLRALIREEPEIETVGIIYGAGHLVDLQERIETELGYTPGETRWLPAITIDVSKTGLTSAQAQLMRDSVRRSLEQQIKAAKREKKRRPRKEVEGGGSDAK